MRNVIFLDRDGIINIERSEYTFKIEDFKFTPHLIDNLKTLRKMGFEFIVITNQGGISRKIYSHQDVLAVHQYLIAELKKHDIELVEIFYCPHHNTIEKCLCRKPLPLMIEKAVAKYNINKENSYMIGDSDRDSKAAQAAGIQAIQVESNRNWLPPLLNLIQKND